MNPPDPARRETTEQPLSQALAAVLTESGGAPEDLTLNRLFERTQGRGIYLLIILLCLPFVFPVSLPGLSTVLGSIIFLLSIRLAVGWKSRLPRFLGERRLPPAVRERVLNGSIRFLRFVEKFSRPRRTRWLGWPAAHFLNCLVIALLALLLALPLPSPPFLFSNSIPGYAIILMAVALMEEDGVLIWVAYAALLGNLIFFGLIADAIAHLFLKAWHYFQPQG